MDKTQSFIDNILQKLKIEKAKGILIVSTFTTNAWFK